MLLAYFLFRLVTYAMPSVSLRDMNGLEAVKAIPVVLVIVETFALRLKTPARHIRFFGISVQFFGGKTFWSDSAAVKCKPLSHYS
jgi:hypothetical protein